MGICWYCHWGWAKPVADIYDEALFKKTISIYKKTIKLLCFLNIITFKLFEDRLLHQAEIAGDLYLKAIEENFNNTSKNVSI